MSAVPEPQVPAEAQNVTTLPLPAALFELSPNGTEAPILRPTMEEFSNFEEFVRRARAAYTQYGLVKVIPPEGWKARKSGVYDDVDNMTIPLPIKQMLHGTRGVYQQYNIEQKPISVADFRVKAEKVKEDSRTAKMSPSERDRAYWRTVAFNPVLYGADMPGSLFDSDQEVWNLAKLPNLLDLLNAKLPGVNDPYIYFGMWKAAFAWHVEDMDLYSINYLHFGEPKAWYSVPQHDMQKFEWAASSLFPDESRECKQFLRHKQTVINPAKLRGTYHVTIHTTIQEAGQFVITWPGAYHAGFNHGFNCAEAINFAMEDWIPWGNEAKLCRCDSQRAVINMQYFIYQYELRKYGRPISFPDLDVTKPYYTQLGPSPPGTERTPGKKSSKGNSNKPKASPRSNPNGAYSEPNSPSSSSTPMNDQMAVNKPVLSASSPKKKITFKFVTVYETATRPQLIRAPLPGARISPRFHPQGMSAPRAEADPAPPAPTPSKKRQLELDEDFATHKLAKLAEGLMTKPAGLPPYSVSAM